MRGLLLALLLAAPLPASADFLVVNRAVSLEVMDAYGLKGLRFRPACADPWDGEVVAVSCEWRDGGHLVCPPFQADPPRGGYMENRWNRFIGCFGGSKRGGFWTHGPANGCTSPSGAWSYWRTATFECCEPVPAAFDSAHPDPACFPVTVPTWGHQDASVTTQACASAIASRRGIALLGAIDGFEEMVSDPPQPGHDGEKVECRILKRDLHALALARQPPALPSQPPGLDGGGGTDPPIEPPPPPSGSLPLDGLGRCETQPTSVGSWSLVCGPGDEWICVPSRWAIARCLDADCAGSGAPFPSKVTGSGSWSGLSTGGWKVSTNDCSAFGRQWAARFTVEVPMAGEPPIEPPVPPECPEIPACPECPACPPPNCPEIPECPPAEACPVPVPRQIHLNAMADAAISGALAALGLTETPLPVPPPSAGNDQCPGCFYGAGHYEYIRDRVERLLPAHLPPSPPPVTPPVTPPVERPGISELPCDRRGAVAVAMALEGTAITAAELEGCRSDLSKPPPGSGNWPIQCEAALCLSGLKVACDKLKPFLSGRGEWGINGWESWSPLYHSSNVGAVLALANDGPPDVGALAGEWLRVQWTAAALMAGPIPATMDITVGLDHQIRPWRDRDWNYSGPVIWAPGERACRNPDDGDLCPHTDNTALHMALGMALDFPRSARAWSPVAAENVTLATLLPFVLHQYAPGFGGFHNPAIFGLSPADREALKRFILEPTAEAAEALADMTKGFNDPREMRILRGPGWVVSFWEGPTRNSNKPAACLAGFWGGIGHYVVSPKWKGVGAAKCGCGWDKSASVITCDGGAGVMAFQVPKPTFWVRWKGKMEVRQ